MAQTTTIDGVTRESKIKRIECEWAEAAVLGEVASGKLRVDDDQGDIAVVGHKAIVTNQSSCAAWPRLFTGFVGPKTKERGAQYVTGAGREITVTTTDANDLLQRLRITGSDGNRPRETIDERLAWILASDYVYGFADLGNVASSSLTMTKTDYRGQYPGDVIAGCAKRASFNYYIRYNDDEDDFELVFRDDDTSTDDTSTISIVVANDGTVNSTSVFAPSQDTTLDEDPEHVYSGTSASYSKSTVYVTRSSTASAFVARDGATDDSGINTAAQAREEAEKFLDESATEEHVLHVTLRMRAAYVNLIRQGQRVPVSIPWLAQEGYDAGAYWRVLRRKVTQPLDTDDDYDVALDLSPQEAAPTPSTCAGLYPDTAAGIYYPLGGPNPCCTPYDVGANIAYYFRSGWPEPWFPQPEYSGQWHFPTYGIGGEGTRDTFASGFGNILKFIVVGSGTLTIQTSQWAGQSQPYTISVWSNTLTTPVNSGTLYTGIAGDSTDVEITADTDDCIHVIDLRADARSSSYIGMGWAQAEWVPA